jgi:hypothetical protein
MAMLWMARFWRKAEATLRIVTGVMSITFGLWIIYVNATSLLRQ